MGGRHWGFCVNIMLARENRGKSACTLSKLHSKSPPVRVWLSTSWETVITAFTNAGETLSDGLVIAIVLKGLSETFKPFAIHIANDVKTTFAEFKTKLRSYEDIENMRAAVSEDNIMKARLQPSARSIESSSDWGAESMNIVCRCGVRGHKARTCESKQWYKQCKSITHRDATCRRTQRRDNIMACAVQTAAVLRNRCFNNCTKRTAYFMLTGRLA